MKTGSLSQERKKNLRLFLRRMTARKIVLFGLIGTLFFVILALFAPLIATADPNEMAMLISSQTPVPRTGSVPICTGATFFPAWCTAHRFR